MRIASLFIVAGLVLAVVHGQADSGPAAPFFVRSNIGFGHLQRGAHDTLVLEVGSTQVLPWKAEITVEGDSAATFKKDVSEKGKTSVSVAVDLRRLQFSNSASIRVHFTEDIGLASESSTAERTLTFVWDFVGVQIDSASSIPFEVGKPHDVRLAFATPTVSAPIDSFAVAVLRADSSQLSLVSSSTSIPPTITIPAAALNGAPLGSKISVFTRYRDNVRSSHRTIIDLPIEPHPMAFSNTNALTSIRTNANGPLRSATTPIVPVRVDTLRLATLPDATSSIVIATRLLDEQLIPLDTIAAPTGASLPANVALPVTITNIDIRSTSLVALVNVRSIPTPFQVEQNITFAPLRPIVRVTSTADTLHGLHLRRWNPRNDSVRTMRPDTSITMDVKWPLSNIDSLVITFTADNGSFIGSRMLTTDRASKDRSESTIRIFLRDLAQGVSGFTVQPFIASVPVGRSQLDSTVTILPAHHAFELQHDAEKSSSGVANVQDILTVTDLTSSLDSVRLRLIDADSNTVLLDSTATAPSVPYRGNVLFSSLATLPLSVIRSADTLRTVGFFLRSSHASPFTVLRWQHANDDLVLRCQQDGTIHASCGTDSLLCSTVIRDGSWKHIAVVVRDTGIALFVNDGLQGVIRRKGWKSGFTPASRVVLGDAANTGDSLFAASGFTGWSTPLQFWDLQRAQVHPPQQTGAAVSYPLYNAVQVTPANVYAYDALSRDSVEIEFGRLETTDTISFARYVLNDIGAWDTRQGRRLSSAQRVNAIITSYVSAGVAADTVPALITVSATSGDDTPDSAVCASENLPTMRLESTEGWGPFNTLAQVHNTFTFHGGYTWGDVAKSTTVKKSGKYRVSFWIYSNVAGEIPDSLSVIFTKAEIEKHAPTDEVVVTTSRPLRMDKITDFVTELNVIADSVGTYGLNCLNITAKLVFSPPPPLVMSYTKIGPFRQPKIYHGERLWNTFTVYTDDAVETGVDVVVMNDDSVEIIRVKATKKAPGVWTADIDMGECDPPHAMVRGISYSGTSIKRTSVPQYFSIVANRPAWLAQTNNVRWSNESSSGDRAYATATISTGPGLQQEFPHNIPLLGGFTLTVLPNVVHAALSWDLATNVLRVDPASSSISSSYGASSSLITGVNDAFVVVNNGLSFIMTVRDIATSALNLAIKPLLNPMYKGLGSINLDLQSASGDTMRLDKHENLEVVADMSQNVELYYSMANNLFQAAAGKIFQNSLAAVENFFEGPVSFLISPSLAPTFATQARLLFRTHIGSDSNDKWVPLGSLPVVMGDRTGPSLTGVGASIDVGVAVSLQVLKGAGAITAYITGDLIGAYGQAVTNTSGKIASQKLWSLGTGMTLLVQTTEAWGLAQQTIYGPTTFFKTVLAGDDLRDLYPRMDAGGKQGEGPQGLTPTKRGVYPITSLAPVAAPMPHTAQHNGRTATVWVDQDHATKIGILNIATRRHGHDTVEQVIAVERNANSIVTPHVTFLTDTTVMIVWKQLNETQTSAAGKSLISVYASSEIHWACVNIERAVTMSSGTIRTASHPTEAMRGLLIDGNPTVARRSDTSAFIVWVATDTIGQDAAILSTEIHGVDGQLTASPSQTVARSTKNHNAPHVSALPDETVLCTWFETDTASSVIHQSLYDGTTWSADSTVPLAAFHVNHLDVDDGGLALVASGYVHEEAGHEGVRVLRRDANAMWDASRAISIAAMDREMMMDKPRIAVRGDSAFVLVRAHARVSGEHGKAVHRLPSAVVDLRTGAVGTGTWMATDSLMLVNDLDIQWEPSGVHVITQEHLPYTGLHTNGMLKRPLGLSHMNLGMHTISVREVITGLHDVEIPTSKSTSLVVSPTPSTSAVTVSAQQPFQRLTVVALDGSTVATLYTGTSISSTQVNVDALPSGTYFLQATSEDGGMVVSFLRIAR